MMAFLLFTKSLLTKTDTFCCLINLIIYYFLTIWWRLIFDLEIFSIYSKTIFSIISKKMFTSYLKYCIIHWIHFRLCHYFNIIYKCILSLYFKCSWVLKLKRMLSSLCYMLHRMMLIKKSVACIQSHRSYFWQFHPSSLFILIILIIIAYLS